MLGDKDSKHLGSFADVAERLRAEDEARMEQLNRWIRKGRTCVVCDGQIRTAPSRFHPRVCADCWAERRPMVWKVLAAMERTKRRATGLPSKEATQSEVQDGPAKAGVLVGGVPEEDRGAPRPAGVDDGRAVRDPGQAASGRAAPTLEGAVSFRVPDAAKVL